MPTPTTIPAYVAAVPGTKAKAICRKLRALLDKALPKAESKIWHRTAVWFDDGNPLAGFSPRKDGSVKLLFWSGQSFREAGLTAEGFKSAGITFADAAEINAAQVKRWCREAKKIQWDYKNIVKRRGKLVKLGSW